MRTLNRNIGLIVGSTLLAACTGASTGTRPQEPVVGTRAQQTCGVTAFPKTHANVSTTDFTGLKLSAARALATRRKLSLRVLGSDGRCEGGTDDLQISRVNVYLSRGIVVAVAAF